MSIQLHLLPSLSYSIQPSVYLEMESGQGVITWKYLHAKLCLNDTNLGCLEGRATRSRWVRYRNPSFGRDRLPFFHYVWNRRRIGPQIARHQSSPAYPRLVVRSTQQEPLYRYERNECTAKLAASIAELTQYTSRWELTIAGQYRRALKSRDVIASNLNLKLVVPTFPAAAVYFHPHARGPGVGGVWIESDLGSDERRFQNALTRCVCVDISAYQL